MAINDDLFTRIQTSPVNRRRLVGGIAGAAVVTVAASSLVSAQSSDTTTATPEAGTDSSTATIPTSTNITNRVATLIASVQADRDAVATSIDTATVDELISLATDLQAKAVVAADSQPSRAKASTIDSTAETSTDSATPAASTSTDQMATTDTSPGKCQLASAASMTARAARNLIVAELAAFGLPSQQIRVSETLVAVYGRVTTVGTDVSGANDEDSTTLVTYAQEIYSGAYEAYGAGTFAEAAESGEAVARLVDAASALIGQGQGQGGHSRGGNSDGAQSNRSGHPRGGSGSGGRSGNPDGEQMPSDPGSEPSDSSDESTPVEVPAPTF